MFCAVALEEVVTVLRTLSLRLVFFFQIFHLLALCTAVTLREWLDRISFRKRIDISTTPIIPPTAHQPPIPTLVLTRTGKWEGEAHSRSLKSKPVRSTASSGPTLCPG